MSDKEVSVTDVAVRLAAGILSGSGVSNKDTKTVSELAVKHAYALIAEIKKEAEAEEVRIADEKGRAAREKKAADDKYESDKKAIEEKAAKDKARLDSERKVQEKEEVAETKKHDSEEHTHSKKEGR